MHDILLLTHTLGLKTAATPNKCNERISCIQVSLFFAVNKYNANLEFE